MSRLNQYRFACTNAMFNYLKDGDDEKLMSSLRTVEEDAKERIGGENASLHFKFGSMDTLCTTIGDIEKDVSLPSSHPNKKYLVECFEGVIGLEPCDELRVYYS